MSIISSLGAGSGIDITNLISSLVEVERAPTETRLEERETKLDAQISAYGALKNSLADFQGLVTTLSDNDTFNARGVTFPDTDAITPSSIDAGAQVGSYQVEVVAVAQSQTLVLESAADKDDTLGLSGNLTLEFGAWASYSGDPAVVPTTFEVNDERDALTLEISSDDSLSSIAQKINDADIGVTASVLKIDNQFQLMLNAPSGASNALRITSDNTASLGVFEYNETTYADVIETQRASDAELVVNGLTVTRNSNDLSDVITGFNFTLNKSSEGQAINFTVEAETQVAEQAIRDLVEGFNLFVTTAKGITGYSRDEENNLVKGDLATDSVAKSMISRLRETMISAVTGVTGDFNALASIGIKTNLDGSLSIDSKTFSDAIKDNFSDIEALFAPTAQSASTRVQVGQGSQIDKAQTGVYSLSVTQDATQGQLLGAALLETFDVPLDTSLGDYSLSLNVSGTSTAAITLSGSYASAADLAVDLETLINADANLSEKGLKVDVAYDADNNHFSIVNRRYGSASTVTISANALNMADLGLTTAQTGTDGVDVAGTINGEAGFGSGRVLLPGIDSPAYGLVFTGLSGAAAAGTFDVNFSRGVAGQLNQLIGRFLERSGPIATRETSIESQLERVDDDRSSLDRRIDAYEARITAQFIAMERIINSLNTTGSALDGIVDRLPFTASRN